MKKWLQMLLVLGAVLFISINVFLVEKANSKVDRVYHISEWAKFKKGNMIDSFTAEGVIIPNEIEYIYVDPQAKFQQFLVKEGDTVENGTPLFEYASDDINQQLEFLQAEISRLESEKRSVDSFIRDLESKKNSLVPPSTNSYNPTGLNYDVYISQGDDYQSAQVMIEQAIAEKKLQKERIDHEIDKYEEQRDSIESGRSGLTVMSPIDGIVKDVSVDLTNPAVTIVSETPLVEGKFTEVQRNLVSEGLKVHISSPVLDTELHGTLGFIEKLPENDPSVEKSSAYRFTANIDPDEDDTVIDFQDEEAVFENEDEDGDGDEEKEIHIGYHVTTEIITEEANNVIVAPTKSVRNAKVKSPSLWVLTPNGMVEKRDIQTGLQVDKEVEIKSGVEPGEYFVKNHREAEKTGPFITSLQIGKLKNSEMKNISKKKALKYMLIGVLQR